MPTERVATVVGDLVDRVNDAIAKHEVTYDEYHAAMSYLIRLGEAGEWPLFLDVFFEHTVERLNQGEGGTIEGPYYVPGAPWLERPYVMPMREDEKGDSLILSGTVRATDGEPIPGAVLDMWQADADTNYSNIQEEPPPFNLRGKMTTDENGEFEVRTIVPPYYHLPRGGPMEELLNAAGWHDYRPGHLHFIVSADGYTPLTTQLYFEGDRYLDSDVASAVKPELILTLQKHDSPEEMEARGMKKPFFTTSHEFRLKPQTG